MRLNCYAEEITTEVALVHQSVKASDGTVRNFYGVRLFLASPQELHHTDTDDDRSAITLWADWTKAKGVDPSKLEQALAHLLDTANQIPRNSA